MNKGLKPLVRKAKCVSPNTATGARLYYEDRGRGEPFILVHGLIGSAAEHFPRVMDWLEPNYRVLGLTLRGYGHSTPKPRDFPLRFYHRC